MKNNANIVFLFLFIFFSEFLSGQNPIEFKDFLGIEEQSCKDEVIESAIGLREKLTNNGSGVYIALANVYAPSVYMNKVEGLNAMEKVTLDHLNSNHQNYIVYLAKVNDENGSIDIKLHFKLASDKYHNGCLDRLDLVKNHINKTLKDEVNKDGVRIADIGCIVNKSMSEFSEFLGSGCANNQEIINTWFLTNEFENIQLPGFTLDYGNPERGIQELISSSRSFCSMIIDYTQGELKCEIGNTGLVAMNEFLSGVQLPSSFRIIITDKYIAPELLTQIEDQEYNSSEGPFCEAVVWFHFTEKFQGEGDQVFIKVDRKDNAECYEGCFTYEELKTKYKSSSPPFSNIKSIDWRLYQYKDQIIDIIKSGEGLGLNFENQQQLEYYAGIVSGFTDALIDDIDFISLIMQMTYDFGREYAPWSVFWWSETIIRVNNRRNLYNAICEKWDDTYEFWKSLSNNAMVFMHPFTSQTVINAMFPTFVVIMDRVFVQVLDGIKDWRDKIIFKEGNFEAGYVQGQLLTILIPGEALFKGLSKGTKVIRESKNVIGELTEHIVKQIDDDAAKAIGEKIAISLPDLYKKLGPNTKVWFKGNMTDAIKREIAKHIDDADFLSKLDYDLGHPKWSQEIKELISAKPADLTDKYKLIKDDPGNALEVAGENSEWADWSKKEFFKAKTLLGKQFEIDMLNRIKTRIGEEYAKLLTLVDDLGERRLLSQVQFCLPGFDPPCKKAGEFFVADQVWVKFDANNNIVDMVIVDSKLSKDTGFTTGQNAAKNHVGGKLSYKPNSPREFDIDYQRLPSDITQGTEIEIKSFYKLYGDGNGNYLGIQ